MKIHPVVGGYGSIYEDNLFKLLDCGEIVAPLTGASAHRAVELLQYEDHPLVQWQLESGRGGVVFFSSATTGEPKVILHDYQRLRSRYAEAPSKPLRSISFLAFDHIGGFNTLLYSRATGQEVVRTNAREPAEILRVAERERVELLPVTPTFLRIMDPDRVPRCVKVISYGSERMDEPTLHRLCDELPWVDFRQMYGATEIGILHLQAPHRGSLYFRISGRGGGTEALVVDGELVIRSRTAMVGYLNAPDPFRRIGYLDGYFYTGDLVEGLASDPGWIRIAGRRDFVINVGGLKVLPGEVEDAAMRHPAVLRTKAHGIPNALTGQAIQVIIQFRPGYREGEPTLRDFREHFARELPEYKRPHRIIFTHEHIRGKT